MILFAPFAARSPSLNGQPSPKDYPWPKQLAEALEKDHALIQVGGGNDEQVCKDFRKNLSFNDLGKLILESRTGISADSYLQHCYWYHNRRAIVLFGISDDLIFGHPENLNLLVDRRFLRPKQYDLYYLDQYNPEAFVRPQDVLHALCEFEPK